MTSLKHCPKKFTHETSLSLSVSLSLSLSQDPVCPAPVYRTHITSDQSHAASAPRGSEHSARLFHCCSSCAGVQGGQRNYWHASQALPPPPPTVQQSPTSRSMALESNSAFTMVPSIGGRSGGYGGAIANSDGLSAMMAASGTHRYGSMSGSPKMVRCPASAPTAPPHLIRVVIIVTRPPCLLMRQCKPVDCVSPTQAVRPRPPSLLRVVWLSLRGLLRAARGPATSGI